MIAEENEMFAVALCYRWGLLVSVLMLWAVWPATAQEKGQPSSWTGKFADGRHISGEDIERILSDHQQWIETEGKKGLRADLSRANLREISLEKANLSEAAFYQADLSGANLSGADLRRADLSKANLSKANLNRGKLEGAGLSGAELSKADMREVDLRGAVLTEANVQQANLNEANMEQANLSGANLNNALLHRAYLRGAYFYRADLSEIDLSRADLSECEMTEANMSAANLNGANLRKANLYKAKLEKVSLDEADLCGASLKYADLSGSRFEPKPGAPKIMQAAMAIGLASLRYEESAAGLLELREGFKKSGAWEQERAITYAIRHNGMRKLWDKGNIFEKIESFCGWIFFELPCQYGLSRGRPLMLLVACIILFAFPYSIALRSRTGATGIWVVPLPDRLPAQEGLKPKPTKLTTRPPFRPLPVEKWKRPITKIWRWLWIPRKALYFSFLSAFSIGWRELNVSNWIIRMQKREYTLKAAGWVRFVSGFQSLLSVYLLALWVLIYFGRPFDA